MNFKKYKHWIIAIGLLVIVVSLIVITDLVNQKSSTDSANVLVTQVNPFDGQIPYSNSGPEAKDDNFFIPGSFNSIADLNHSEKPTIVWISASWCQVCHEMRKFIWKSANTYSSKLVFKEIDFTDNYNTIILPNYLFSTPTFLVIDTNGAVIHTFYGADEEGFNNELETIINTII